MAEKKRGFTIIELIIVILALAILAAVAIPTYIAAVKKSQAAADIANVKVLNDLTAAYRAQRDTAGDVFSGITSDAARIQALIDAKLLSEAPTPRQENASFEWSVENQTWVLNVAGEAAPLTALGSTFAGVSDHPA